MARQAAAILATYEQIRRAVLAWNWADAERLFCAFCDAHQVPEWFADEYLFNGMKLWADGRPAQLLRHFAAFFERGLERAIPEDDAIDALREAASLM